MSKAGAHQMEVVIDLRDVNQRVEHDLYPVTTQEDITRLVAGCEFITVMDASSFFYQWKVRPDHAERLSGTDRIRMFLTFRIPAKKTKARRHSEVLCGVSFVLAIIRHVGRRSTKYGFDAYVYPSLYLLISKGDSFSITEDLKLAVQIGPMGGLSLFGMTAELPLQPRLRVPIRAVTDIPKSGIEAGIQEAISERGLKYHWEYATLPAHAPMLNYRPLAKRRHAGNHWRKTGEREEREPYNKGTFAQEVAELLGWAQTKPR
jgi:hypothetical protein